MNNNEFEIMLNDLLKPVKETNVKIVLNKADDENFYFFLSFRRPSVSMSCPKTRCVFS